MIKKIRNAIADYYTKEQEINITLFKILGVAGVIVSFVAAIESLIAGGTAKNAAVINFMAGIMAILLLWFVEQSGEYVVGYLITTVTVFMGLFAVLFFKSGGMDGSMPYFFVFGLVFSFMMYEGILLSIVVIIEMLFYTSICVFSLRNPGYVTAFESPEAAFIDKLTGLIIMGLSLGFIVMLYIGEYKKQQKIAEEASNAKSLFLANISHDLRSPINMMLNMNKMVMRESGNERINEYAGHAYEAGNQLMFLVNQLLDLSRLEKGSDVLAETDYDFFKAMNNLTDYFKTEAEKKGLSFVCDIDRDISEYLYGDIRKITRLITNIGTNAVKYTDKGYIKFTIKNLRSGEGIQKLYFEVSDTGIGIKKEELSNIFQSFERSESVKLSNIEGLGLGLAISAELAQTLNTAISVKSEYQKGSTFSFELEQKIGDKNAIAAESRNQGNSFIAPDVKILVVDDNPMNLYVMKALLKRTLIDVDTAENAEGCMKKCRENKYDLIFMDYMMPKTNGIDALNRIRQDENLNRETKVFVLTADVSPGTKEMLLSNGFTGYLAKPVDGDYLENLILSNIPTELIQVINGAAGKSLSESERLEYAKLLSRYDIDLDEGLRFVRNDISQYVRVCRFFFQSAKEGMQQLNRFMLAGDYEKVAAKCHSLKGNAWNVGGTELHTIAKNIENHARNNDTEYVCNAIKLLYLEWNRTKEGLLAFIKMYEERYALNEDHGGAEYNKEDAYSELKGYVEEYKQAPSLNIIKIIKRNETDEQILSLLNDIEAAIVNIEFDEAEALIARLVNGKQDPLY